MNARHAPIRYPVNDQEYFGNAAIRGLRCARLTRVLRLVLHRAPRFSEGAAFPFVKPIAEMSLR